MSGTTGNVETDSQLLNEAADGQGAGTYTLARIRNIIASETAHITSAVNAAKPSPTGPVTNSTVAAPPAATAAGFTKLVFNDDFISNTIALTYSQSTGVNWYWDYDNTNPGGMVFPTMLASQVKNGNSSGGSNASPDGGILSIQDPGGPAAAFISVPGYGLNNANAVQPAAGQGNWQHFYVEIYTQFNIATAATPGTWPSFWSWSLEGLKGFGFGSSAIATNDYIELDFYESFGAANYGSWNGSFASTIHHWQPGGVQPASNQFVTGYPAQGGTPAVSPYFDNEWHTIGCLWQHDPNPAPISNAKLVQSANARGTTPSASPGVVTLPTFASSTTSGNVIIVSVQSFIGGAITVTDTLGTVYRQAAAQTDSSGTMWNYLFYGFATATGTNAVTATQTGGYYYTEVTADEFSGVTAFDVAVHATAASGAITAPAITTSGSGLIYVSAANLANGSTWTAGTGFALTESSPDGAPIANEYTTTASAKTGYVATISNSSTSGSYSAIVASFLAPTATPTSAGKIQMYFDNVAVGPTILTGGPGSTYPLEGQHLFLVLASGAGSPTYIDWVRVWQAP